ncbi:MAG: hypothetical protein AAF050_11030 [Cyanobacteria bacterium J06649_5]
MANKKTKKSNKRLFSGMGYREVQRANSSRRAQLPKADQGLLKQQGYKNVGWDNVIALYQKLNELSLRPKKGEDTLEELFLKADRIGNKYQTAEEIADFNRKLATEVNEIADVIDQQFPETETESIDYRRQPVKPQRVAKRKHR